MAFGFAMTGKINWSSSYARDWQSIRGSVAFVGMQKPPHSLAKECGGDTRGVAGVPPDRGDPWVSLVGPVTRSACSLRRPLSRYLAFRRFSRCKVRAWVNNTTYSFICQYYKILFWLIEAGWDEKKRIHLEIKSLYRWAGRTINIILKCVIF